MCRVENRRGFSSSKSQLWRETNAFYLALTFHWVNKDLAKSAEIICIKKPTLAVARRIPRGWKSLIKIVMRVMTYELIVWRRHEKLPKRLMIDDEKVTTKLLWHNSTWSEANARLLLLKPPWNLKNPENHAVAIKSCHRIPWETQKANV